MQTVERYQAIAEGPGSGWLGATKPHAREGNVSLDRPQAWFVGRAAAQLDKNSCAIFWTRTVLAESSRPKNQAPDRPKETFPSLTCSH